MFRLFFYPIADSFTLVALVALVLGALLLLPAGTRRNDTRGGGPC